MRWRFAVGFPVSPPLAVGGTVYAGAANGIVYAVDAATGQKRWELKTGGPVVGAPALINGTLYVGSWSGGVYALDPDTGAEKWHFQADSLIPAGVIAIPGGNVCVGDWAANVYCLRATDGSLVWKKAAAARGDDAIWSTLGYANGRLFAGV